jgi:sarcosine oxidase
MAWFEPRAPFATDGLPVFILQSRHGMHYGIPPQAGGDGGIKGVIKIAKHHHRGDSVDPDTCDRAVTAADEALIRPVIAEHLPAADGRMLAAKTCLYTMTPDGDFLIDRLPGAPAIIVASPCSGHGFKFAPVIGEAIADLVTKGETRHDMSRFRFRW